MKVIILILILILSGCSTQNTLSELQIESCNVADEASTCNTKLQDLGIVLKEDCCQFLGKCCQ